METELKQQLDEIKKLTLLGAKNVLNINDVALLLGKSPRTVRNIVDEIPHYRNGHGIWFKREDIEAWQCQVRHETTRIVGII
jgi:transcriptional antiterminator